MNCSGKHSRATTVAAICIALLAGFGSLNTASVRGEGPVARGEASLAQAPAPTASRRPTATQQVMAREEAVESFTPTQPEARVATREAKSGPDAPAQHAMLRAITTTIKEQFAACNEADLEKLMTHISGEQIHLPRFRDIVDASWRVNDTYCRLDNVELLADSDNAGARFEHPYATVRVTQTVIQLPVSDPRYEVFLRKCKKDDSKLLELADQLDFRHCFIETTSTELLYKDEDGTWRFVNALAEPVPSGPDAGKASSTGVGVPYQYRQRISRSAFK